MAGGSLLGLSGSVDKGPSSLSTQDTWSFPSLTVSDDCAPFLKGRHSQLRTAGPAGQARVGSREKESKPRGMREGKNKLRGMVGLAELMYVERDGERRVNVRCFP